MSLRDKSDKVDGVCILQDVANVTGFMEGQPVLERPRLPVPKGFHWPYETHMQYSCLEA